MSTRRARIKAVTSLPPRRKNNDNGDKNKPSTISKDEVEKLKSPKIPRSSIKNQECLGKDSPKSKIGSPLKSPRSVNNNVTIQSERILSPTVKEVPKDIPRTPKTSEKVSVITSTSSIKPVFISPRSVDSPLRKSTVPTPKASVDAQKVTTPEKMVESPKLNNNTELNANVDEIRKTPIVPSSTATDKTKNDLPDDYNVPSVPESVTEDGMDGIVPLQPVASAPKPIALLKNEIISENAEVLFDPIVPLPSPSKVRAKLRPIPRLNPVRRNSIQGSASESEDESRRGHINAGSVTPAPSRQRTESYTSVSTMLSLPNRDVARVRNDSVCSSVSQIVSQPPAPASPLKEKQPFKSRRQDMSRRMAAMRRRRETVKRDALTMYDLIFYNPTTNPIVPNQDELNAIEANEKVETMRKSAPEPEKNPDDPPAPASDAAPVPQIKLGPNGEIILDEQSLVIKQSEKRTVSSSVVIEGSWTGLGSGRYKRGPRTAEWNNAETVRFYRALAALGTDFMLMERLFPGRTRRDLKLKFKKEERVNAAQVDKALRTSSKWDATKLEEEFTAEREAEKRQARHEAERVTRRAQEERERHRVAKELHVRQSKASKAMESSILPDSEQGNGGLTADDFIRRHLEDKGETKGRKRKPRTAPNTSQPVPIAPAPPTANSPYAQLTLINSPMGNRRTPAAGDMASILKADQTKAPTKTPELLNSASGVPSNIESGSLVVLTVDDPKSPSKKMLQTYIAHGGGKLTPVALPPNLLNSVVSYMKKGTPRSTVSGASSPSSIISQDSRSTTPGVILPSPAKRQRHSSYTITQL
ncbi:unnamed protein product [Arctia plantaginis]|uniref:Transcription factor TFIIIB component B'' Myb domain-containing protein n=1 Tax=Arctia plantaginis TaxID=874455 RepID=A0A8S1BDH1_ARCPL|nr:unnamed protein product [Arctia plantaginis]CAB3257038.1 unnamed protein product [Arctia plantaginis]